MMFSIACSAVGCTVLTAMASLAIGHVDASSLDLHSSRVNTQRYPFGQSASPACNTILKTIPRGGAKSLTPLPPPVDEEAAAEAARASSVKSAFEPDTLPSPPEPQPASVEAAQAPPPRADHTKNLSAKLSNAWERTVPAVLMLAAATALLKFTGTAGLTVLIFALQIGMYHETTSIIEQFHIKSDPGSLELKKMSLLDNIEKWWWFATVILGTSGRSVLMNMSSSGISEAAMNLVVYGMAAIGLVGAVVGMEAHSRSGPEMFRNYLGGVAGCHFVLVFLVCQSSYWIKTVQEFGLPWVLYPALLVIVNDTMAYVFGLTMGKHKLLPRLSPKKTVEGFAGALLSTVGISVPLLRWVLGKSITEADSNVYVKLALTLGVFISLVSPFGGFLASAVKRAHGAKDFGKLIPGHGGVVDRFDCQIVTAPFVFLLLKFFGVAGVTAEAVAA